MANLSELKKLDKKLQELKIGFCRLQNHAGTLHKQTDDIQQDIRAVTTRYESILREVGDGPAAKPPGWPARGSAEAGSANDPPAPKAPEPAPEPKAPEPSPKAPGPKEAQAKLSAYRRADRPSRSRSR